jgi:hypothetical protein
MDTHGGADTFDAITADAALVDADANADAEGTNVCRRYYYSLEIVMGAYSICFSCAMRQTVSCLTCLFDCLCWCFGLPKTGTKD